MANTNDNVHACVPKLVKSEKQVQLREEFYNILNELTNERMTKNFSSNV